MFFKQLLILIDNLYIIKKFKLAENVFCRLVMETNNALLPQEWVVVRDTFFVEMYFVGITYLFTGFQERDLFGLFGINTYWAFQQGYFKGITRICTYIETCSVYSYLILVSFYNKGFSEKYFVGELYGNHSFQWWRGIATCCWRPARSYYQRCYDAGDGRFRND